MKTVYDVVLVEVLSRAEAACLTGVMYFGSLFLLDFMMGILFGHSVPGQAGQQQTGASVAAGPALQPVHGETKLNEVRLACLGFRGDGSTSGCALLA